YYRCSSYLPPPGYVQSHQHQYFRGASAAATAATRDQLHRASANPAKTLTSGEQALTRATPGRAAAQATCGASPTEPLALPFHPAFRRHDPCSLTEGHQLIRPNRLELFM